MKTMGIKNFFGALAAVIVLLPALAFCQIPQDYFVRFFLEWLRPCLRSHTVLIADKTFERCVQYRQNVWQDFAVFNGVVIRGGNGFIMEDGWLSFVDDQGDSVPFISYGYRQNCDPFEGGEEEGNSNGLNVALRQAYCTSFNYLRNLVSSDYLIQPEIKQLYPRLRVNSLLKISAVQRELRNIILGILQPVLGELPSKILIDFPNEGGIELKFLPIESSSGSEGGSFYQDQNYHNLLSSLAVKFDFTKLDPFKDAADLVDYLNVARSSKKVIFFIFPSDLRYQAGFHPRVRVANLEDLLEIFFQHYHELARRSRAIPLQRLLLGVSADVVSRLEGEDQHGLDSGFGGQCSSGYTDPTNISDPKVITPCNRTVVLFRGSDLFDTTDHLIQAFRGSEWGGLEALAKALGYRFFEIDYSRIPRNANVHWLLTLGRGNDRDFYLNQFRRLFEEDPVPLLPVLTEALSRIKSAATWILTAHGNDSGLVAFVKLVVPNNPAVDQISWAKITYKFRLFILRTIGREFFEQDCLIVPNHDPRARFKFRCIRVPNQVIYLHILCSVSDYRGIEIYLQEPTGTWNRRRCNDWMQSLPAAVRQEIELLDRESTGLVTLSEEEDVDSTRPTKNLTLNLSINLLYGRPKDLILSSYCGQSTVTLGLGSFPLIHDLAHATARTVYPWQEDINERVRAQSFLPHARHFDRLLHLDLAGRKFFVSEHYLRGINQSAPLTVPVGSYTALARYCGGQFTAMLPQGVRMFLERAFATWGCRGENQFRGIDSDQFLMRLINLSELFIDGNVFPQVMFGLAGSTITQFGQGDSIGGLAYPEDQFFRYSLRTVQDSLLVRGISRLIYPPNKYDSFDIVPVHLSGEKDYRLAVNLPQNRALLKHLGFSEVGNSAVKVELAPSVKEVYFNPRNRALSIDFTSDTLIRVFEGGLKVVVSPEASRLLFNLRSNGGELISPWRVFDRTRLQISGRRLRLVFKPEIPLLKRSDWNLSPSELTNKYGVFRDRSGIFTHYEWPYFIQIFIEGFSPNTGLPLIGNSRMLEDSSSGIHLSQDPWGYETYFIWPAPLFDSLRGIFEYFRGLYGYAYTARFPPFLANLGNIAVPAKGSMGLNSEVRFMGPYVGVPKQFVIRVPLEPTRTACLNYLANVCTTKTGGTGPGGCVCDPTTDENCEECSFRLCEAKVQDVKCEEIDYIKCELAGGACCDRPRGCRDTEPCEIVEFFESQEEKEQFKADCESRGKYFVPRECRWLGPYGRCCGDPVLRLAGMECSPEVSGGCCPPPAEGSNPPGGGDSPNQDPSQCSGYWWYDQYVDEGEVRRCPEVNIPCEEDDDNQQNQQNQCNEQNGNGSGTRNNKQNDKGGGGTSATSGGTGSSASTGSQGSGNSGNQGSGGSSGTSNLQASIGSTNVEDCPIIIQGGFKRINRLRDRSRDIRKELRRKELKRKWTNRIRLGRDARDPRIRSRVRPILRYLAVPTCHWPGLGRSE